MSIPSSSPIRRTHELLEPHTHIEYFIHGALCVAFSGQCNISFAHTGRSANRGECSQACRLPYTLADHEGRIVAYDKHLLSMKDNDQSGNLRALVEAGVRSFKIEGRYKDMAYVKNATAHYRQLLDEIIAEQPQYSRASSGVTRHLFVPQPEKTFNRSSTDYFTNGRKHDIGAFETPKFSGEAIGSITKLGPDWFEIDGKTEDGATITLHNGDGVSYQPRSNKGANKLVGMRINVVQGLRLFPNEMADDLQVGMTIYRNRDQAFERQLEKESAERRIGVQVSLYEVNGELQLTLTDSDGISATVAHAGSIEFARDAEKALATLHGNLGKFGNTDFEVTGVDIAAPYFVPASALNALRREATAALIQARVEQRPRLQRAAPVEPPVPYLDKQLDFLSNVFNTPARNFYKKHGVELIADAYEEGTTQGEVSLMITKHCLRYSFNLCPKEAKDWKLKGVKAEPMTLINGNEKLKLRFDCKACEMHVVGKMKPGMKIQLHSS
ncbi:MAG: U32 family peptidase [Rhodocyclaceae bacterium]|nr:U32 family peptidase [Rhodocyclaceae bacterium]